MAQYMRSPDVIGAAIMDDRKSYAAAMDGRF
jgi:hypothetical protein